MQKLILIRHGETNKNVKRALHSARDLGQLNDAGKRQMKAAAKRISQLTPISIYSSREVRAVQSAEIIAQHLSIKTYQFDDLQERNWGIYSGKPWSEIAKVLNPMNLEERYEFVPENGESWKEFETRLTGSIEKILTNEKKNNIAVVTHGGVIRALMPHLLNVPRKESFKYDPDNGSITVFNCFEGKFIKITVNNTSHLV